MESKTKAKLREREQTGSCLRVGEACEGINRYKLPGIKLVSCGDVIYSVVTVLNNTLLAHWKVARRIDLNSSYKKIIL